MRTIKPKNQYINALWTTLALKAIGVENNKKYYDMNQILTYAKFSE